MDAKSRIRILCTVLLGLAVMYVPMSPAVAGTPSRMLVIANRIDDIVQLDPAEIFEFAGLDLSRNVYDRLVDFDPMDLSKGVIPSLAESWQLADDGKTYTFKMRAGVKFHSGNPVTARDAEFSLRRAVLLQKNSGIHPDAIRLYAGKCLQHHQGH